ncbi:MAG: hypothetical protein ACREQX_19445 [Candidatus Binataceae bacterium]
MAEVKTAYRTTVWSAIVFAIAVPFWFHSVALAQQTFAGKPDSDGSLAEREYDPTATLTQVQIKDSYTSDEYGSRAQPNALQIRPILAIFPSTLIPFPQLLRLTFRIVTKAEGGGPATVTGYDDMQLLDLLVAPWPNPREINFRWGFGPYFVLPTSTTEKAGQGAWQMGPALGFSYRGIQSLNLAGLVQQGTSFAYTSSHSAPVTSISFQPMISYQLGDGYYLKSSDAILAFNLRHNTSTTIPISAGAGKVWKLSQGYSLDTSVSGEWMVYGQFSTRTEKFTLSFQISRLLPKVEF